MSEQPADPTRLDPTRLDPTRLDATRPIAASDVSGDTPPVASSETAVDTSSAATPPGPVRALVSRLRGGRSGPRAVFGALGHTRSPRFVLRCFVASRLLVFVFWGLMGFGLSDTEYYFLKMSLLGQAGPAETMIEYPTPVLWYFQLLYALSFHVLGVFVALFIATMMALDLGFTSMLWRSGGERRGEAVFFWTVFLLFLGPTAYLRFDLVTAVLAAMALMALVGRQDALAGVLTGVGAGIKLWPALLYPALLGGSRRTRVRATVAFGLTGLALALAALWYAGWNRLLSPLTYQSQRGLQIESLWAVPPMLARLVHRASYAVTLSIWNSFEISGPATEAMLTCAKVAQYAGIAFVLVTYVLWLRRGRQRPVEAAALMLTVILMMILTNKAFSPQYMMWLGAPAAAGIAILPYSQLSDDTAIERRRSEHEAVGRLRTITRVLLVCTALTTLVYPIGYTPIVQDRLGITAFTLILAARNLLLLWLFWLLVLWVWHFAWRDQRRAPGRRERA